MEKLSVKKLSLSLGILSGVYVLILGWAGALGWGVQLVELISSVYIGYAPTFVGSIIGAVYGFIDGVIAGAIIALLYNWIGGKK